MRRAAKSDNNTAEIANAFRGLGCSVEYLSPARRGGLPDLLVGIDGRTLLVEVKAEKGKLSDDQINWHASWRGAPPHIVRTLEDVGHIVNGWREVDKQ